MKVGILWILWILCVIDRYSPVVLPWSRGAECLLRVRGRPRKARLLPPFRVIVGVPPHASKSLKIR